MTEKNITGYLIVDWRDETHRTRKSKPSASELGANELLAELDIRVSVPEVDVPTLAAQIEVPEPRVHAATLEALDDEDLPDWTDVADEVIQDAAERGRIEATDDRIGLSYELVGRVMASANGRPDADLVNEYVDDQLRRYVE